MFSLDTIIAMSTLYSLNRFICIGRSPYEAPDSSEVGPSAAAQARSSLISADGYVQQYDERGHPINPASRTFGRELRRAKNDILSTMGIVVSGEDGSLGTSKEKQKVNLIATENDYGLVMATLDQVFMFLGSWWTTSLGGRIQTFKSYTHVPLMRIIRFERRAVGLFGVYFAGIPAWTTSFFLSICRNHLLEPLTAFLRNQAMSLSDNALYNRIVQHIFSTFDNAARGTLLILFGQTYMFSLLQSLHLVHHYTFPGIKFFIPFSDSSLIQFPSLPSEYTFQGISQFGLSMFTSPFFLIYVYVYLRPIMEARIYRLIRRRLPKPDRPDELSIRVAIENDLVEWTVPTLGRRSDEEARRSNFTLLEEIRYELLTARNWMLSWFGWRQKKPLDGEVIVPSREETIESLRYRIGQLQNELGTTPVRGHPAPPRQTDPMQARGEQLLNSRVEGVRSGSPDPALSSRTPQPESLFDMEQVLSNEDQRLSQSPLEMANDYFDTMPPLGRTGVDGISREMPSTVESTQQSSSRTTYNTDGAVANRRDSRSNTLFSRPSSPESSPLTSPRVRASLVHQNSDVITMQLELLTNRNPGQQDQAMSNNVDRTAHESLPNDPQAANRRASELLDALLSNQGQTLASTLQAESTGDNDGLSGLTVGASPAAIDNVVPELEGHAQQSMITNAVNDTDNIQEQPIVNVIPGGLNQPIPIHTDNQDSDSESDYMNTDARPLTSRSQTRRRSTNVQSLPTHRVTILSSHPVDSLSSHLASLITNILFIPFESLYLRALAISYLSSPASGPAAVLRPDIRDLTAFAGGGSTRDMLTYAGKLVLVFGMQAAVSIGVWGIGTATAIGMGRKRFGWGNL
ncbi:hypothetical protein DTO027B5_7514 [Paecilomyces variotii]|nr:hypothetical protein DTO169C6_5066 [Paecilomyces variotii]KAJ9248239.1 hypothetical protein DTO207G8_7541 [Paecilomyces variotii]KAJ9323468.1 hypothetical protein DTO027B3_5586 [Paecilomyces variotii]KAJ9330713.1 hypothetical protein DTO027B5_7514 [Paecilomyces variotii]KAJ9364492.1 hypothetical protein DTO280E4_1738 [Paecilomyces variotii]